MSAKLPMWDVVSVTHLSGQWRPGHQEHWSPCLQTVWEPRTGHSVLGMLCWPGDTWAVLSLVPPLPPDIPLQCLRHQVNGFMATLAWRESLQPIYPVNNFNQIHYPDKSVINCHILHAILFPKIRKGIPNNGQSEKQRWFTPELRTGRETGGPFVIMKPRLWLTNFCCRCEWSQQVQKQFWSFITFHRCDTMWPPPTPPWSVRSLRCPAEQDKRHREAGFTTPALDTRERGAEGGERLGHIKTLFMLIHLPQLSTI